MTPYSHVISCGDCNSQLNVAASRNDEPKTSTTITISCPACLKEAKVTIPVSIEPSSLQIVWYEKPNPPAQESRKGS